MENKRNSPFETKKRTYSSQLEIETEHMSNPPSVLPETSYTTLTNESKTSSHFYHENRVDLNRKSIEIIQISSSSNIDETGKQLPKKEETGEMNCSNLQEVPLRFEIDEEPTSCSLPPKSKTPKIETPNTPKTTESNERFKGIEPIPSNELPPNVRGTTSYFYHGNHANLPLGWLIEKRPRTSAKYVGKFDQFFYEPDSGKQFRSLKAIQKIISEKNKDTSSTSVQLENGSLPTIDHGPEKLNKSKEEAKVQGKYPWEEMRKNNKRKRSDHHHQPSPSSCPHPPPTFDFNNIPKLVTWSFQDGREDLWLPEFEISSMTPSQIKKLWTEVFMAMNPSQDFSGEENSAGQTDASSSTSASTSASADAEVTGAEETESTTEECETTQTEELSEKQKFINSLFE